MNDYLAARNVIRDIGPAVQDQKVRAAQLGEIGPKRGAKKPRTNWQKELRAERARVLDEAISVLRAHQRAIPKAWMAGYNSAASQIEILKQKSRA